MSIVGGRLLHVMLHVNQLDRSLAFYTGALGMHVLRQREIPDEGRRVAFVGFGEESTTTVVELTEWANVAAPDRHEGREHLAIGVPNAVAACDALRASGAPIVQEPTALSTGTAIVAFTRDPDGYLVEIVQRLDWPPHGGGR